MEIIIEAARNGEMTCKIKVNNNWKYLYSKYIPNKINPLEIQQGTDFIIIFGLGLGYEYDYYRANYDIPIYVVESENIFRDYNQEYRKIEFINSSNLNELDFSENFLIIEQANIMDINPEYYYKIKKAISYWTNTKERICLMDHGSLLNDCAIAFEELGYEVEIIKWLSVELLRKNLLKSNPKCIFSINFSLNLAGICEELKIPYISWTVDTPAYSLFSISSLNYVYSYKFVYDEEVVMKLKASQVKNIYYLPVAVNTNRYNQLTLNSFDLEKYKVDVSFLGNSCGHNEYLNIFERLLTADTKQKIENIVCKQIYSNEKIISELIDDQLIIDFENETGYSLFKIDEPFMSKKHRLFYLIGRYHSYVERKMLVQELGEDFSLNIYGDGYWLKSSHIALMNVYRGYAENFGEMPKIFKASKINVNNIRTFVESGLPQRVFDVLGCKGFLVTNSNRDIEKYFENNRDLVVYRDIQDLKEIIAYYLVHENERDDIAAQGHLTVSSHSFKSRIEKMLNATFEV